MVEAVSEQRATYTAVAERDGSAWFARVEGVQGAIVQARRLEQIEPNVREVVAMLLDVPDDSFDVVTTWKLEGADEVVRDAIRARKVADREAALASMAMRAAAHALVDRQLTIRDIGRILGISHQRVAQLLQTPRGASKWSEVKASRVRGGEALLHES